METIRESTTKKVGSRGMILVRYFRICTIGY